MDKALMELASIPLGAIKNLTEYQRQLDVDGCHVGVSRQALDEVLAYITKLQEANGILEDALQEVGDDYPGSSCQEWCIQQVKLARSALASQEEPNS